MIDAEVLRLRRLRDAALRVRAVAMVLNHGAADDDSLLARSSLSCWRIAGVATGRLRAHPYLSYQRGPGVLQGIYDRIAAAVLAGVAMRAGRPTQLLHSQLQRLTRELDDARALTWLPELSDTLGRLQKQLRDIVVQVAVNARREAGSHGDAAVRTDALTLPRRPQRLFRPG